MPTSELLPDESPAECPVCQKIVPISPSDSGDGSCPFCGTLVCAIPGKRFSTGLAGYRLRKRLGRNRFLAVSTEEQFVQLHVLPRGVSQFPYFVKRWNDEIAAASDWDHPNISRIVDHGSWRGYHYVVFGDAISSSAAQIMERRGRLSLRLAIHLITGCCHGLCYLHDRGIVHRGISPESIVFGADKCVRITANILNGAFDDSDGPMTRSGVGVGIEASYYAAPEVWTKASHCDARSDIYALGLCFYRFVSGEHPVSTDSLMDMVMQRMKTPASIRTLQPDLPDAIAELIDCMVDSNPEDRPQSAQQVLNALGN